MEQSRLFGSLLWTGTFALLLCAGVRAVPPVPPPAFPLVPGVVIAHSPALTRQFIGSPGIVVLPDGNYLAKCDLFGPGTDQRHSGTTRVFGSADRGRSWTHLADVQGLFWASVFVHNGAAYLLGVDREYGNIVIRRSDDGGRSWTTPADAGTGLLRDGGQYACAPTPVVEHGGRLWQGFERRSPATGWAGNFGAFLLSAPAGADLLRADSWTGSAPIARNGAWNGRDFGGWLEGNAVAAPDGGMVDVLRVSVRRLPEKAALVHVSADGTAGTFDPARDIIDFPGGATKFTIRFDPATHLYWSLTNAVPSVQEGADPAATRNTLVLMSSPDLRAWTVRTVLLAHPDRLKHAFQYVDWQFDGDDIIAAARTAFDDGAGGADSYHNADFLTFHRFARFRSLTMADSPPVSAPPALRYETDDFVLSGRGFTVAPLAVGGKAFSNRAYVWSDVPDGLAGDFFTQTAGGVAARIVVRAKRDTTLRFATALSQPGVSTDGWQPTGETFHLTDRLKTVLSVFSRRVKAGNTVAIPQGNWTGGLVLLAGPPVPGPEQGPSER